MSDGTGWTPPAEPGEWQDQPGHQPEQQWGSPQWGAPAQGEWGQQNAPWGTPATKPGVVPLRPLAVSEILDGAFTIMRHYPKVTLGLSAIVATVTNLALTAWAAFEIAEGQTAAGDVVLDTTSGTAFVVGAVANAILAGMLTSVAGEAVLGREATIGGTWRKIRPRFWALLFAGLFATVLPLLGLILLAIPGIFLWGALALVTPALVLERATIRQSFKRSWRLAVPDWWRVWGIRALAFLVSLALLFMIAYPGVLAAIFVAERGGDTAELAGLGLSFLAQTIAATVTAPFTAGVLALLYIDRRMRAEGLDVTLAQAAAAEAGRF